MKPSKNVPEEGRKFASKKKKKKKKKKKIHERDLFMTEDRSTTQFRGLKIKQFCPKIFRTLREGGGTMIQRVEKSKVKKKKTKFTSSRPSGEFERARKDIEMEKEKLDVCFLLNRYSRERERER